MEDETLLPVRILHDIVERFHRLNIAYMLTGSTALMHYAIYRFTADIDVVLEFEHADQARFIAALEPDYYIPHAAMQKAISSRRMFNVIHSETAYKVDCVIKKTSPFHVSAFGRRRQVNFRGKPVWIISKEDLILSKLVWAKESGSEMQLRDVNALIRTGFEQGYIETWAPELGVLELFRTCKDETKS